MHGKTIRTLLIAVLVFFAFSASAYAEQAIVTGNEVNVRSGPGLAYSNFTSLTQGMTVEVLNRSNADWYQVSWDGNTGYVYSGYLKLADAAVPTADVPAAETSPGYINAMYVSLRSGPGTNFTVLGTYSNGKGLTIRGSSGQWTAVTIDGKDGYVYGDYVSSGFPPSAVSEAEDSAVADLYGGTPIAGQQTVSGQSENGTFIGGNLTEPVAKVPEEAAAAVPASSASDNTGSGAAAQQNTAESSGPSGSGENTGGSSVSATLGVSADVQSAQRTGEISGNYVRFRTGPGTNYSIIDTYSRGTSLQITGASNGWTQAVINGVSGYIFSDYVKESTSVSSKAETAGSGQASAVLGQTAADSGLASANAGQASAVFGQASAVPSQAGQNTAEAVSQTLGLSDSSPESFTPRDGYINGNGVRLRQAPSMTAAILNENLVTGNIARILGVSGDWTRVIVNGQEGFVYSAYVKEGSYTPAESVRRAAGSNLGKEIADYALTFVGTRYTWGGKTPATGFDCSGFVQYVFSQYGITTSPIANDVRNEGVHVDPADIQPGDVLCFYSGSDYVGHVGIYIGENSFVHAANSAIGVVTTSLSVGYYAQRGYEIRRMI